MEIGSDFIEIKIANQELIIGQLFFCFRVDDQILIAGSRQDKLVAYDQIADSFSISDYNLKPDSYENFTTEVYSQIHFGI